MFQNKENRFRPKLKHDKIEQKNVDNLIHPVKSVFDTFKN